MKVDVTVRSGDLVGQVDRVFELAASKARLLDRSWLPGEATPVFTVGGKYTSRGWTEWTQGFQFGCLLLAGEGVDDARLIARGRQRTLSLMRPHLTHMGVHDHGSNTLSTYGVMLRLASEGTLGVDSGEVERYRDAIAVSGAVQASRWTATDDGKGFVHSFNGAHSLFIDTMRTLRVLGAAHLLGHVLQGEQDVRISLLGRAVAHAQVSDRTLIYHGESESPYDVAGRTAHEALFNPANGSFRSRSTQQGYSPFSTWSRGLGWAILGYAEQLELLSVLDSADVKAETGESKRDLETRFKRVCTETCDHYISDVSALNGIPYWDDGAPGMAALGEWRLRDADPFNAEEPVDSSAAAIAAQGLIRFGLVVGTKRGEHYVAAGLNVARALMAEPYLSVARKHQGLLLHSGCFLRINGYIGNRLRRAGAGCEGEHTQ